MDTSTETAELAAALAEAQAELPVVPKRHVARVPTRSGGEYAYKYADLEDVVSASRPVLAKHALAVMQMTGYADGHDTLTTRVMHRSGQWAESTMRLFLAQESPQAQGSALTYARRYAWCAALGIVADEDDDAQAAEPATSTPKVRAPGACKQQAQAKSPEPWWRAVGYPDEDEARQAVDGLNAAMRQVPEAGRPAVRAWLTGHGYPASLPVLVRAEHVEELEGVLAGVLVPGPDGEPFEEVPA